MKSEFKDLKLTWDKKLRESGFIDIEDSKMRLKTPDSRTQNFKDREALLNFFLDLDHYLTHNQAVPTAHRRILELYSQGVKLTSIAIATNKGKSTIKEIILKYKSIVLGLD